MTGIARDRGNAAGADSYARNRPSADTRLSELPPRKRPFRDALDGQEFSDDFDGRYTCTRPESFGNVGAAAMNIYQGMPIIMLNFARMESRKELFYGSVTTYD